MEKYSSICIVTWKKGLYSVYLEYCNYGYLRQVDRLQIEKYEQRDVGKTKANINNGIIFPSLNLPKISRFNSR